MSTKQPRFIGEELGVRYYLGLSGAEPGYFGSVVESGSHQNSLRMILNGLIDAAALDSTVLEAEIVQNPSIAGKLRTIAALGPSPAPPWVVHRSVSNTVRRDLRRRFLAMHRKENGRKILDNAAILRFAAVSDRNYDLIREMDSIAVV